MRRGDAFWCGRVIVDVCRCCRTFRGGMLITAWAVGLAKCQHYKCPPYKIDRFAVNTRAATVRWAPRAHAEIRIHGTTFQSNTVNTANVPEAHR